MKKVILFFAIALIVIGIIISIKQFGKDPLNNVEETNEASLSTSVETSVPDQNVAPSVSIQLDTNETEPPNTTVPTESLSQPTIPPTQSPTEEPAYTYPTSIPSNQNPSNSSSTNTPTHTHELGTYQVNQFPTAAGTEGIEIYRFCKCGYRDSRYIPSLEYNVIDLVTGEHICALYSTFVSATCLRAKYSIIRCTGCDYYVEQDGTSTQLAEHNYSDWEIVKEATSSERGERARSCTVCGHVFTEVIPATDEEREQYIDSRISIETLPTGLTSYTFNSVSVNDVRSWGDPPVIRIMENGGFDITYWKADGSKIEYLLSPVADAHVWITICEDGNYIYSIFDGFENMDGTSG